MPQTTRTLRPGPRAGLLRDPDGALLSPPEGWECLPPGDAAVTRRLKSTGPHWVVKEKRGRREFSRGVWAPAARIAAAQRYVERMRASPTHQRKLAAARNKRAENQRVYVQDFQRAVHAFLRFPPQHAQLAQKMAHAVAVHATPVGSGTVARTQRIPLVERAEAAVIAWMRHQTTAYDDMVVPRVKGQRRAVRRKLAARSHRLLARYRRGDEVDEASCPLAQALKSDKP